MDLARWGWLLVAGSRPAASSHPISSLVLSPPGSGSPTRHVDSGSASALAVRGRGCDEVVGSGYMARLAL